MQCTVMIYPNIPLCLVYHLSAEEKREKEVPNATLEFDSAFLGVAATSTCNFLRCLSVTTFVLSKWCPLGPW